MDLFLVSVLLDAGAGDFWKFSEPKTNNVYERSEGIAVASLYMSRAGSFSEAEHADRVDGNEHSSTLKSSLLTSCYQGMAFLISPTRLLSDISSYLTAIR